MKKLNLILILLALVSVSSLTACKKKNLDTYKKYIENTLLQVSKITENFEIKDDDFVVYSNDKTIEIIDGNATVTTVTKELSSTSYQLETSTEVEFIENIDTKKLISLDMKENNVDSYEYKNDVLTIKVSNSSISTFFGGSLDTSDDIDIHFTFKDKLLTGYFFEYALESGRSVSVSVVVGE